MSSSVRRSADHENRSRHLLQTGGISQRQGPVLALACLLATAPTFAFAADDPASAGALAKCSADTVDGDTFSHCLERLELRVAERLDGVLAAAVTHFAGLDAITGNQRASRTLEQGQAAFALYRDLDCHLVELAQGVSLAAVDHRRACRIDHDRARIAQLSALLLSPVAETPADEVPPPVEAEDTAGMILATAWRVSEIDTTPVAEGVEITLAIDGAGAVSGRGGCNRYFGTAEITGEAIDLGSLGSTRMACEEPTMAEEHRYLQALDEVAGWRVEGDTLSLLDGTGAVRVRLERDAG